MGTRARRQEHGRRPHRPHRPPRTAHQIRGPLLPKRTRPHDQITNTTQTGSGRYRTPCGKPAAYTAEKHRSQSGRQLAKTQATAWNGLSASAGSTYRPERISSSMAAANDSASARVLNALLLRFLEPSGKVAHQDTRHRFPCPYRAVLNFPGTLAFSGVFIYAAKLFVTELGTGIFTLLPSGNVSRGSVSQRSSIQAFDIAFPHTCNEFFKGDIPVFRLRNRDGIYVKRLNTTPCLSYSIEYSVSHFIWNAIRISA